MQINYPNEDVRRATAEFWYAPTIQNTIQAMDVPPVYAPYGTDQFWPNAIITRAFGGSQNAVLNQAGGPAIAPSSAMQNTVAGAAMAAGLADAPPAANVPMAKATGASLGPVSLVAPMPSITQSPSAPSVVAPVCSAQDTWISQNPFIAALIVGWAYMLLRGRR